MKHLSFSAHIRICLAWRFVFAIASPFLFQEQARAEPSLVATPNIIYILADDLGIGDVQYLNRERGKIPTPHLDRLANSGITFFDAHSGSSVCTPTRYGILTGRYAWRTRLQKGVFRGDDEPPLIDADRITVPSFLRQHGYHTACLGKWHLGFTSEGTPNTLPGSVGTKPSLGEGGLPVGVKIIGGPTSRGFDHFFGFSNSATMSSLIEDDRVAERIKPIDMLGRLADRAAAYIHTRTKTAQPFFLYLALNSPHAPITPASDWHGKSGLGPYGDFVMQTDDAVGRVLEAIDAAGIADKTLVIFASDNGCSMVADIPSLERQGHFPSGPYRGSKSDIWEGGHRVPLLVRWPDVVKPGSTCTATVCLNSLLATCADILGKPLPPNVGEDSVSLLPHLRGESQGAFSESSVIHHSIDGMFAIRHGEWKLILGQGSGGWTKSEPDGQSRQLYNLKLDPAEQNNRIADEPTIAAALEARLKQSIETGRTTDGPRQANDVVLERDIVYGKGGATDLRLDLARPNDGAGPYPAIVFVHGGGWQLGSRGMYLDDIETAAKRGYVAITVSYRLTDPDNQQRPRVPFPAQIEDVKCAVRWLRANAAKYQVDPDRIGAIGASAGGHLSLLLGVTDPTHSFEGTGGHANQSSRVQAVVNFFGPTDLIRLHESSPKAGPLAATLMNGSPTDRRRDYELASPVTHVSRDDPPVLTIHGDQDVLVPLDQATRFDEAMKRAGAAHTLLVIRGAGHGFNGANAEKAQAATFEFFDKVLRIAK